MDWLYFGAYTQSPALQKYESFRTYMFLGLVVVGTGVAVYYINRPQPKKQDDVFT